MTVRRTFLQSLVGPAAYKRLTGVAASAPARRARFRPSSGKLPNRPAAAFPRKVRIRKVSAAQPTPAQSPSVRKLPPAGPAVLPKPLKPVPKQQPAASGVNVSGAAAAGQASATTANTASNLSPNLQRALAFLRLNGPVLLLNFGSLCTLAGFTRTDVLELRIGNLIGNTCGMTYFIINRLIPPFTWSTVFGMTNAYNIHLILEERSDKVVMSKGEQALYEEHFLNHGVTPKQFAMILEKSTQVTVPKGQIIIRANTPLDSVYLVVKGRTEASILGRHLTYASSLPGNSVRQKGGDSGAWIGEIAFLESFWRREQLQRTKTKRFAKPKIGFVEEDEEDDDAEEEEECSIHNGGARALHTIVCTEDAKLRCWSHADLEEILKTSSDMRAAMTRAMTAAVVGKVVNFTVSRGQERERGKGGNPTWSAWLQEGAAPRGEVRVTKEDVAGDVSSTRTAATKDKEVSRRESPRAANDNTTREAAIEAFRQVLLGQQAMDRSRSS